MARYKIFFWTFLVSVLFVSLTNAQDKNSNPFINVIPLKQNETENTDPSLKVIGLEKTIVNDTTILNQPVNITKTPPKKYVDHLHDLRLLRKLPEIRLITKAIDLPIETNETYTISSPNYPQFYPNEDAIYEWNIKLISGNGLEMIVKTLDLAADDYLLIKPGTVDTLNEKVIVFAWDLKTERKFKLIHMDELYLAFNVKKTTEKNKKGFQIVFQRTSELITTTPIPSTTKPPNTVVPLNNSVLYIGGKTPLQFKNISEEFRFELAGMAEKYCAENSIKIEENLNILDNVNYHLITMCNVEWPDSKTCTKVLYSIPVYYNNETDVYELTTKHLDDMWMKYSNTLNTSLGVKVYHAPDDHTITMIWVGISIGVIIMFIVGIMISQRFGCFYEHSGSPSMRGSLVSQRKSDVSLFPAPHQTVPPLYGLDYYTPEDDRFWAHDEDKKYPPKYSEEKDNYDRGHENLAYDPNVEFNSDEIVMSFEDVTDHTQFRMRQSGDKADNDESFL